MPVRPRERHVRPLVHRQRRRDVQEQSLAHPRRVGDAELVRHAGSAVVRTDVECGVAERGHDGGAVGCHGAFAVGAVRGAAGGFGGAAVAADVEEDEGVGGGEVGGDEVPD